MRFRKKPVVIDAVQWKDNNANELRDFMGVVSINLGRVVISTLEGIMYADEGDWIIRGVKGEFYPCKPDIFEATYEPAYGRGAGMGDKVMEKLDEQARELVDTFESDCTGLPPEPDERKEDLKRRITALLARARQQTLEEAELAFKAAYSEYEEPLIGVMWGLKAIASLRQAAGEGTKS